MEVSDWGTVDELSASSTQKDAHGFWANCWIWWVPGRSGAGRTGRMDWRALSESGDFVWIERGLWRTGSDVPSMGSAAYTHGQKWQDTCFSFPEQFLACLTVTRL